MKHNNNNPVKLLFEEICILLMIWFSFSMGQLMSGFLMLGIEALWLWALWHRWQREGFPGWLEGLLKHNGDEDIPDNDEYFNKLEEDDNDR